MKTMVLLISMVILIGFTGCSPKIDTDKLLENKATRTEIFNAISNDQEHMAEFYNCIKDNKSAMMMMNNYMSGKHHMRNMHGDQHMMSGDMMNNNQMMDMMHNNTEMMNMMMENMMDYCDQNDTIMSHMANIMAKHPKMVETCLQLNKNK